jgi:hypothetical protein
LPDHRKLLLISVIVLTALFFIDYFFVRENLPDYIPNTPIKAGGVFLFLCFLGVYYVVFKRILKEDDTISVFYLMVFGLLIVLFSEVIFQFYRATTLEYATNGERTLFFIKNVLLASVVSTFWALMMAFDFKYKNPLIRWLSTAVGVGLIFAFKYAAEYLEIIP